MAPLTAQILIVEDKDSLRTMLEEMLKGLGARLQPLEAPFEPEAGAYGAHHRHDNESGHGGKIHDFAGSSSRAPQGGDGPGPNS